MARRKRGRAGGFGLDAAERRTVLLWCLTGVAGSGVFEAALLCFSIGWGEAWKQVWAWAALLLPGAAIGIGQRAILRRRLGAASSGFWLAGSIAGDLALLAPVAAPAKWPGLALLAGLVGLCAGALQMWDIDRRFVRGERWVALTGLGYALGCTLAYALGDALPWGADVGAHAGALLSFPCVALFTGLGIVFVTRGRIP